jgi:hypothetical protein
LYYVSGKGRVLLDNGKELVFTGSSRKVKD